MVQKRTPWRERFWQKTKVCQETGCILWTAALDRNGYGQFQLGRGQGEGVRSAHILAWEIAYGPVPKGMCLDHLCRVHNCVNVKHLRVVTPLENSMAEGSLWPGKLRREWTHCIHGHIFDERNTYYRHSWKGKRMCRRCTAIRVAKWKKGKKNHACPKTEEPIQTQKSLPLS